MRLDLVLTKLLTNNWLGGTYLQGSRMNQSWILAGLSARRTVIAVCQKHQGKASPNRTRTSIRLLTEGL
jgi:hypothetical protein